MKIISAIVLILFASSAEAACTGSSPTWSATPDSASVQSCVTSASNGDKINVSSGSATWAGNAVIINKVLTLNGAGQGVTNITVSGAGALRTTKQATGVIRVQNFTFISTIANTGVGPTGDGVLVNGTWPSGQPVIFQNDTFNAVGNETTVGVLVAGGAIFSHCIYTTTNLDGAFITVKDLGTGSWTTADSMGARDTNGLLNIYVEDSTFARGSVIGGVVDCDDNCRIVWRHNTHSTGGTDAGGFNSHGWDSSPYGMRHFEIYNNSFLYPDRTCPGGSQQANINQWIWIRGATGVIFNNNFDPLYSTCWGDKAEMKFSIRGAEDDRPQGTCAQVSYPVPHQLGQNNNGSHDFTDPIWIWGNTSNTTSYAPGGVDPGDTLHIVLFSGWANFLGGANPCFSTFQSNGWGNTDADQWTHFFQFPRDTTNTTLGSPLCNNTSLGCNVEAIGGTAKPGYAAFTYPHPLVNGGVVTPQPPQPPTSLTGTVH